MNELVINRHDDETRHDELQVAPAADRPDTCADERAEDDEVQRRRDDRREERLRPYLEKPPDSWRTMV